MIREVGDFGDEVSGGYLKSLVGSLFHPPRGDIRPGLPRSPSALDQAISRKRVTPISKMATNKSGLPYVKLGLPDIQKRTGKRQDDYLRGLLKSRSDREIGNSESLDVDLRAVGECPQFQWRNTMFM